MSNIKFKNTGADQDRQKSFERYARDLHFIDIREYFVEIPLGAGIVMFRF